jgi:hypothetical protein
MKKLCLLAFSLFLAAFLFCQNVPRPTETPGSIEDALAAAKARGRMVLVDFFSPG